MNASNIKGALLEYIVRNLLKSCGFTNVKADNLFSFEQRGLFFVNGKGAAHDADVIMNPPMQMPFTYPTQLLFECKAYGDSAKLPVVRNALGLRNDLNDFEIVTRDTLRERKNNRRASFAVDSRVRYLYQVGVASINDFTKPAIEFATNNKIPLLSLSWFLGEATIRDFNNINQSLINRFTQSEIENLYKFLKDRDADMNDSQYNNVKDFLSLSSNLFGNIITELNNLISYFYVGLLETGDMIFLFDSSRRIDNIINDQRRIKNLNAQIHWNSNRPNLWTLTVTGNSQCISETSLDFFLPRRILNYWKQFNLNKSTALDIKQTFFSKIFVFNHNNNPEAPFSILNIDSEWLREVRLGLNDIE